MGFWDSFYETINPAFARGFEDDQRRRAQARSDEREDAIRAKQDAWNEAVFKANQRRADADDAFRREQFGMTQQHRQTLAHQKKAANLLETIKAVDPLSAAEFGDRIMNASPTELNMVMHNVTGTAGARRQARSDQSFAQRKQLAHIRAAASRRDRVDPQVKADAEASRRQQAVISQLLGGSERGDPINKPDAGAAAAHQKLIKVDADHKAGRPVNPADLAFIAREVARATSRKPAGDYSFRQGDTTPEQIDQMLDLQQYLRPRATP